LVHKASAWIAAFSGDEMDLVPFLPCSFKSVWVNGPDNVKEIGSEVTRFGACVFRNYLLIAVNVLCRVLERVVFSHTLLL